MRSAAPISSHPSTALPAAHPLRVRVAFPQLAISSFRPQFHRPANRLHSVSRLRPFQFIHSTPLTTPSALNSKALDTEQNPLNAEPPAKV